MSRRILLEQGLFIAVDAAGFVGNGTVNGPKLYIHESGAARRAGPGGTVFRMHLNEYGVVVQRVRGPRVGLIPREKKSDG